MSTAPEQEPQEATLFRTIRGWGITRGDHGVIGGVVEGLGDRVGMARVPARIITVVAAILLTSLMLLAYAAAWGLLPDRRGNIIVQNFGRGIPNVGALIGIGLLALFALGDLNNGNGITFSNGSWSGDVPWADVSNWSGGHIAILIFAILVPLAVIGGIVTLIVVLIRRSNAGSRAGTSGTPAMSPAPAADAPVSPPASVSTAAEVPPAGGPKAAAMPPASTYAAPPQRTYAPAPPAPPRPPRIPGPGRTFYLTALAWAAIAIAAAAWLDREDQLAVHPAVAGTVIFIGGLGVILIAVSLAGRKLGFLGFVGIVSLVPLLIFAGNADSLRTAYADHGGITSQSYYDESTSTAVPSQGPAFDPTLAFDSLYSELSFTGQCYESNWEDYVPASVQRLNLVATSTATDAATEATDAAVGADEAGPDDSVIADSVIDITAEVTYISIASGTNITLTGDANTQATVVFPDRGFTCDFWSDDADFMKLAHADGPTISLVVHDDQYANTIVIKEVTP